MVRQIRQKWSHMKRDLFPVCRQQTFLRFKLVSISVGCLHVDSSSPLKNTPSSANNLPWNPHQSQYNQRTKATDLSATLNLPTDKATHSCGKTQEDSDTGGGWHRRSLTVWRAFPPASLQLKIRQKQTTTEAPPPPGFICVARVQLTTWFMSQSGVVYSVVWYMTCLQHGRTTWTIHGHFGRSWLVVIVTAEGQHWGHWQMRVLHTMDLLCCYDGSLSLQGAGGGEEEGTQQTGWHESKHDRTKNRTNERK